ncbi:unnamed protein product [Caenorhabditis angaria]|uniref:Uncharacterized protein n=1 Tax=Caenorhabditis angaria TaxID=860376 RepID=A0A9P1MXC3_9PELO|nr:unnamed protein product [Caenorhabditis angaria]
MQKYIDPRFETDNDRLIIAIFLVVFPPLAVLLKCNGFKPPVCLTFLLYLLLILPAYFYAVWFCFVGERKIFWRRANYE